VPVLRPRVRQAGKELVLQTYAAYQDAEMLSEATLHACILGVATRGYRQDQAAHATLPEGVPVLAASRSTVSRRFARDTQALLEEQLARPLQGERYLALFLDGVQWGAHQILVALGLTAAGEKQVLGLREGDSENSAVCGALLEDLVARGLSTESGLLAVVDGGKGWAAGIARVLVQRCVVHKARNVMDKLPQTAQRRVKRALATAWTDPNPTRAEQRLRRLADALQQEGYGEAAASLREGLEDTLTHLRLQVPPALARSLRSTNAIESMFSHPRRITRRVSCWRHGQQAERWSAAALMEAEFRLRRLPGSRHLPALQAALEHHARQGGWLAVGA
jgi:transposase-like protein